MSIERYAILRFEKRKGGPATAIEKHHERKKKQYASNPDVDCSRSDLSYHLVQPQMKYYAEIQSRIEKAQRENPRCKVRKDSVKFIDTIVTATPEFLEALPEKKVRRYFERALEFLQKEIGAENIFSAVVHMDERNPHMHLCFVPLTPDNRLSAKDVMGDRSKLVEWQDKFHDYMAEEFPELERGQAAVVTKRKHIPTWLYKQFRIVKEQASELRAEAERVKWERHMEHQKGLSLIEELRDYQDFIDSIPEELYEELKKRYEMGLQEQQQQNFE